jgi:ATP/maltotriose-dependent transcriptional regulator MalT
MLALPVDTASSPTRAMALTRAGMLATLQSDLPLAAALIDESAGIARRIGGSRVLADAQCIRGIIARNVGDLGQAVKYFEESRFVSHEHGHSAIEFYNLLNLALVALEREDARAEQFGIESLALAERIGHMRGKASALNVLGSVLATLAHLRCASHVYDTLAGAAAPSERAMVESEEALRIARAIGWRSGEAYAACEVAACSSAEGQYGRAFVAVNVGQAIAEELEHRGWLTVAHSTRGLLDLDLLDSHAARRNFEHGVEQARGGGGAHLSGIAVALLAQAHLLDGDASHAETVLLEVLDPQRPVETLTQTLLLAAYGEVRLAQGGAAQALDIADRLTTWAAAHGDAGVAPRLSGLRGEALAALGQPAEAEVALRAAIEAARHLRARPCLWRLQLALGRLLHTRGRRHEAQGEYAAARSIVGELASTIPDEAQRDAFRSRAASRLPAVRALTPQRSMQQAYGGLTARERAVAALIGQGLSNAQIAERLVVSERTVESHTGHIRDKLHLTSRAQVATWAIAGGLASAAE